MERNGGVSVVGCGVGKVEMYLNSRKERPAGRKKKYLPRRLEENVVYFLDVLVDWLEYCVEILGIKETTTGEALSPCLPTTLVLSMSSAEFDVREAVTRILFST